MKARTSLALAAVFCAALLLPLSAFAQGAPIPKADNDPKAIEVIENYLKAMGGKEAFGKIKDKTMRFINRKFQPTGVTEMKMARFLKRDLLIREEWELPGMGLTEGNKTIHFVQVYNGEDGWVNTQMGKDINVVTKLQGQTLTVFVWDKFIDDAFMHWQTDGYQVKFLPATKIADQDAVGVETTAYAGRQKVRYYFNTKTHLLIKKEWNESSGNAGLIKKEVYFEGYTKVRFRDDQNVFVRMATNEKVYEDGELTLEKSFQEIIVNSGIDDKLFGRPKGEDFDDYRKRKEDEANKAKPVAPGEKGAPTSQPASKPAGKPTSKPASKPTSR